jgi:hypothetical protein
MKEIKVSERTLISTFTLLGSLATYYYSKVQHKDAVPYVMVGGFIGALVGEIIAKSISKN